jgi:dCTP deaminase
MSVLSDYSIRERVDTGSIGIEPFNDENVQPASYDVMLGRKMYHVDSDTMVESSTHKLKPFERYLGHTWEEVSLPKDVAAQISGRSSIGRRGIIVHKTAGFADPDFSGSLTLEIMNLGNEPVELNAGERVAQLIFFELDQESSGYNGRYQGQEGPTQVR